MSRHYGIIVANSNLKDLEAAAKVEGKHAVGITKSGTLYKWNSETRRAVQVSVVEAAEIIDAPEGDQ